MSSATFDPAVGQTQYLQLFATQLQHQDPLDPVKQEDFLTQLSQFSSVESLQNMNKQFTGLGTKLDSLIEVSRNNRSEDLSALQALNAGASLLGKSVRYGSTDADAGVVDQIKPENGSILVRIGGQFVPIANIVSVEEPSAAGQSAAGQSAVGQSAAGYSDALRSATGFSDAVRSAVGVL